MIDSGISSGSSVIGWNTDAGTGAEVASCSAVGFTRSDSRL